MTTVAVIGAGMMGTALCVPLVDNGHRVRLVGTPLDGDRIQSLKSHGFHPDLQAAVPAGIDYFFDSELEMAVDAADLLVLGVSSPGIPWAAERLARFLVKDIPLLMVTKGLWFDDQELSILPDALERLVTRQQPGATIVKPVAVAGPCIAGELVLRVPTSVVFAGRVRPLLERLAQLFENEYYAVHPATDVVGAEWCAALKNGYAMGIAFAGGLQEAKGRSSGSVAMHNYEAAVFAQAIVEMAAIVSKFGGDPATVAGLAGVGDLNVTCNGGRTGRFGKLLGRGLRTVEAQQAMPGTTLECLEVLATLRSATDALRVRGLDLAELPLLSHLMAVGLDGAPVGMPFEKFFGAHARVPTTPPV